jgi:hypothetical protein
MQLAVILLSERRGAAGSCDVDLGAYNAPVPGRLPTWTFRTTGEASFCPIVNTHWGYFAEDFASRAISDSICLFDVISKFRLVDRCQQRESGSVMQREAISSVILRWLLLLPRERWKISTTYRLASSEVQSHHDLAMVRTEPELKGQAVVCPVADSR